MKTPSSIVECGMRIAEFERTISTKSQIPNHKQISMTKIQNDKQNDLGDLGLKFGIYLEFEICNLGFN
jgi:hypothetical protein